MFRDNLDAYVRGKRRALNEGGTASSKTYSILQLLIVIAGNSDEKLLISVVSESLPHLKRGCIRDFKDIMGDKFDDSQYSKTEQTYKINNSIIEFFGADDQGKVRGPRRNILFINEGNNIPWDTARGLDIRTSKFTFVDWNPVSEFWAHEYETDDGQKIPGWIYEPDSKYIHSTYIDAIEVIPQSVKDNIEANKKDLNWWNIYGLGLIGKIEGLVYPHFDQVDVLPYGDPFYGLDFGYSNDPTVLIANVMIGDSLYSHQMLYERGITNDEISRRMDLLGIRKRYDVIYADSAEPKSIQEIYDRGFNIFPCDKGPGSVEYGHQKVRQFTQYWTKDSTDCIKEQRNFRYLPDKDGKLTEKTAHQWSHGMDARRYAVSTFAPDIKKRPVSKRSIRM